jgi:hypothetical protein
MPTTSADEQGDFPPAIETGVTPLAVAEPFSDDDIPF